VKGGRKRRGLNNEVKESMELRSSVMNFHQGRDRKPVKDKRVDKGDLAGRE